MSRMRCLALRLAGLPAGAAEFVQRHALLFAAEARQQFDVFHRQEQFLLAVVDQAQAVVRGGADLQRLQPVVAADAVVLVHHQVAFGHFGGFGNELVGALAAARRAADALAQQILLADQREIFGHEAAFERQRDQADVSRGVLRAAVPVVGGFGS